MLRASVTALAMAVALACSAGTALGGGSDAALKPTLQIVRETPLTIRGRAFRARERVRVSAAGRSSHVRATRHGTFVVALTGVDRCNIVRIVAVGAAGSRAVLKILPAPQCPPMGNP
jgi:hypothetical protein